LRLVPAVAGRVGLGSSDINVRQRFLLPRLALDDLRLIGNLTGVTRG